MIVWVIGNGPSSVAWRDRDLHPSIGCNYAIKDFDLDHLVCVDRMAVNAVTKLGLNPNTTYWCKQSLLQTPAGWKECETAGIDSGSTAIKLAHKLYPDAMIVVIGFDGVMMNNNTNVYDYHFRKNTGTTQKIRQKHRQAVLDLLPSIKNIRFVGNTLDSHMEVISNDQAFAIFKAAN